MVQGGVLIPSRLDSYTAGTWDGSGGSPAVTATQEAVYLGWRWGTSTTPDLDTAWLQAAVNRVQGQGSSTAQTPSTPPTPANPVTFSTVPAPGGTSRNAPGHSPSSPNSPSNGSSSPSNPPRVAAPPPTPRPIQPVSPPPSPVIPTQTTAYVTPSNQAVPETFIDPSEQTAPAGLEVKPGNQPISNVMAIAMRQELTNLLGRFENALIASSSSQTPVNLARTEELVASRSGAGIPEAQSYVRSGLTTIESARNALNTFPELVNQQNWGEARRVWLAARQQLWENYPTEGERAGAEIRAVWLDRGTIVRSRNEAGLARIFDQLAAAGINTVFLETLNAGYPIYPSQVAPQQNPLTVGWDPLASAVKLSHERGMELHAWLWTFATANQRHNTVIGQPTTYLGPVLTAHPDWANIDNRGRTWHELDQKAYLDPANPEVRAYLLRMIGEITQNYDVDGVQLDYIRYPFQDASRNFTYGYGKAARAQFRQLAGVDPMGITPRDANYWKQWTDFRVNQIDQFVAQVSQFLRQQHPEMILSVAVFPHPEQERIYKIQQHWETWASRNLVDLIVPMTYSLDTNRLQRITQPLTQENRLGAALITPSVKLLNLPEIVAIDQIQALRDLPTGGYSIFAAETINNNLQGFFQRTQGCSTRNSQGSCPVPVIPYRQPFAAAAERYLALKREWSFLLANDQLWIRQPELAALNGKSDVLAQALNQLAANPSPQTLAMAKQSLQQLRTQFDNSMRLQALEQAYQVESWNHRLAGIDMLLRYGERNQLNRR